MKSSNSSPGDEPAHDPLPARALELHAGRGGAVGEQLDLGVGARNADHPTDDAVVREHRLVAVRGAGADVEHQGAQPGAVVGVHDLGDPQGGGVAALEGEGLREPFDLLLEALHAQLATAQLEQLRAQPPVLRREIVAGGAGLRGPSRGRASSHRRRERRVPDCAARRPRAGSRRRPGPAPAPRAGRAGRPAGRREECGRDPVSRSRRDSEEATRGGTSRSALCRVAIIGPVLCTLSISGSRPCAADACLRGRGRCPEPRRPAGPRPERRAGRSRRGCARRAPAAARRRPTGRFPCP